MSFSRSHVLRVSLNRHSPSLVLLSSLHSEVGSVLLLYRQIVTEEFALGTSL